MSNLCEFKIRPCSCTKVEIIFEKSDIYFQKNISLLLFFVFITDTTRYYAIFN